MDLKHLTVFLLSFAIGSLMVYFTAPLTSVIVVYPTPDNVGHVEYKDKAGSCYEYASKKVKCPRGGGKEIPLQE